MKKKYLLIALLAISISVSLIIFNSNAAAAPDILPLETVSTEPTTITAPEVTEEPEETTIPTEPIIEPTVPSEPEIPPEEEEEMPPLATTPPKEEVSNKVIWYSDYRVYPTNTPTTTAGGYSFSREFLAKMVNREASGMNWEGKVYTCSAILNFCDRYKISLNKAGHNKNCFAVAPYVDKAKPTEEDYAVVDYVLNGGRIGEICHFKRGAYHDSFPNIPVCQVGVHYFSIREKRSE